jgi:hypothetical protein
VTFYEGVWDDLMGMTRDDFDDANKLSGFEIKWI